MTIAIGTSQRQPAGELGVAERLDGAGHARLAHVRRVRVAREQVRESAVDQLDRGRTRDERPIRPSTDAAVICTSAPGVDERPQLLRVALHLGVPLRDARSPA